MWNVPFSDPCTLGESPFWHPREQVLYWVDIAERTVLRANIFMGTVERWVLEQEVGCIAPAARGGLVLGLRDGIYRARLWGGEPTCLIRFDHDPATTRFNDGKCDALGRFWAGTVFEPKTPPLAALYSVDCRRDNGDDGRPRVRRQLGDAVTANGLAWSPDAATLYWADTPSHQVRAWDWDAQANTLADERVFQQFAPKPEGWKFGDPRPYGGRPDGAAVDAEGNYWVALFEGGRVVQIAPDGRLLRELPVPALCPTMPCFGGEDLRTLYLTTAREKRPAAELAAYPQSGCVFSTRVDVPGLAVNFFED